MHAAHPCRVSSCPCGKKETTERGWGLGGTGAGRSEGAAPGLYCNASGGVSVGGESSFFLCVCVCV